MTWYEILELQERANDHEVKSAYRRLARLHHPDRNPGDPDSAQRFKRVAQAYECLSDSVRRAAYDAGLQSRREAARQRAEQLQELLRRSIRWDLRRQMERHPRVDPNQADPTLNGWWETDPQGEPYWQSNPFFGRYVSTGYGPASESKPPPNFERLEGMAAVAFDLLELWMGKRRGK